MEQIPSIKDGLRIETIVFCFIQLFTTDKQDNTNVEPVRGIKMFHKKKYFKQLKYIIEGNSKTSLVYDQGYFPEAKSITNLPCKSLFSWHTQTNQHTSMLFVI